MKNKIRLVVLTKEPLSWERIATINSISKLKEYEIVGVFIENSMHLPISKFFLRTIKRIKNGYIYLPEFISSIVSFAFTKKISEDLIEKRIKDKRILISRVKNIQTKDSLKKIKKLAPDLGIIVGHRILPEKVFSIPKRGTINVHHGILPRYAGSHSTFWALVENQKEVGVTIHRVSEKVDIGDILHIKTIKVTHHNSINLYEDVKALVPKAVVEALIGFSQKTMRFKKQNIKIRKNWKPPTFWERRKYQTFLNQ